MSISIKVDTHTHTVLSGHAWSTLRENAAAAKRHGLDGMCLTEHGHAMPGSGPFFIVPAQRMLPAELEGIRIFYGIEANIMGMDGSLDIEDRMLFISDWNIASIHDVCITPGSADENTDAYLKTLRHPAVDMLGHIDDLKTPNHFETVVQAAAAAGRIIEVNNNSLLIRKGSRERVEEIVGLCRKYDARVAVSSDAHFDEMVGSVKPALDLLDKWNFPEELIVNRTLAAFEKYLAERTIRLDTARPSFLGDRRSVRRMAKDLKKAGL